MAARAGARCHHVLITLNCVDSIERSCICTSGGLARGAVGNSIVRAEMDCLQGVPEYPLPDPESLAC
jgi:hypothetical protein